MSKSKTKNLPELLVPVELIQRRIYLIGGRKVMLDSDLAGLYEVTTGNNLAVRRNSDRFPEDFMFQLSQEEADALILQAARAKPGRGGRQTPPYAFTEQGVAMLSSVINTERAIHVNIGIMRAFVQLRELLSTNKNLASKLDHLERKLTDHDRRFGVVFAELRKLIDTPLPPKRRIGFRQS